MKTLRALALTGFVLAGGIALAAPAAHPVDPEQAVQEAKAKAAGIPEQAEALARLAWLSGAPEPVRQRARKELEIFAGHGIEAMWHAVSKVKPEYTAEIAASLIAAFRSMTQGLPAAYQPALEDVVWYGTRDARALAIPELARTRSYASLIPIIDAATEDPELEQVAVAALGELGDPRARFFLARVLDEGKPFVREQAAVALARIGDEGRSLLRSALRSPRPEIRLTAVRAILPVASVEDLTALHEYVADHASDDPATAKVVESAAVALERALEAAEAGEAAAPGPR